MNPWVVFDMDHPLARQNRCFADRPGGPPADDYLTTMTYALQRAAESHGFRPITADLFAAKETPPHAAHLISHMTTSLTPTLLARGTNPTLCFSVESPLTAKRFYHDLRRQVAPFQQAYLFAGALPRLQGLQTAGHRLYIAMESRQRLPLVPWKARRFLTLINSNKRAGSIIPGLPVSQRWRSEALYWGLRLIDPLLRGRELYVDRLEAIHHFARYPDFHLYGYGWEQPVHHARAAIQQAVRRAWQGEIAAGIRAKRTLLSHYRFAICFENTVFPGYLTEKLFDCLLAGCIPIYWGDPTVAAQIPSELWIDYRQFASLAELDAFLWQISPAEAQRFLEAAGDFLASQAFEPYLAETFAARLLRHLCA
jgi:hypothetical protein